VTQIRWAIRDFEGRFKRAPEGMWLPETAVDLETLELLAEHGIRFTILAPHQACRVRPIGEREWHPLNGQPIDPTRSYRQRLPSGRSIALFFYDGPIARAVAFEGVLSHGDQFVSKLIGGFSDQRDWPQLVHIATDGESYGHHHKFGDMELAYALDQIETRRLARLTNYGEFLERHPPTHEVEIVEKSSWSCAHGIDRWWSNCGCNSGGHPHWNQEWRTPLRSALDGLRDAISPLWEKKAAEYFKNSWFARDSYVELTPDRSAATVKRFLDRQAARPLTSSEMTTALKLLELQRQALLMYTSCGWFFDELSGIETVQVIQFAARAVQLAQELFGDSLEERFIDRLAPAQSNLPEYGNGREIYKKFVHPARVDWERVGAHYAVSSLFEKFPQQARIYSYRAEQKNFQTFIAGKAKLAVGEVKLTSEITGEAADLSFGALHMGDHNVNGGVRPFLGNEIEPFLSKELAEPFLRADFPEVIRLMDRRFGESNYSLRSLFRDEQRKWLQRIMASSLGETESLYRQIYENRAPMMRFLADLHVPIPKAFHGAAEFIVNTDLRRKLEQDPLDIEQINNLLTTAKTEGLPLDSATLEFTYRHTLEGLAAHFVTEPSLSVLQALNHAVSLLDRLPFAVNLWKIQNDFYEILKNVYPGMCRRKEFGDETTADWISAFAELGQRLQIKISE
jgi:hypothetical protein